MKNIDLLELYKQLSNEAKEEFIDLIIKDINESIEKKSEKERCDHWQKKQKIFFKKQKNLIKIKKNTD